MAFKQLSSASKFNSTSDATRSRATPQSLSHLKNKKKEQDFPQWGILFLKNKVFVSETQLKQSLDDLRDLQDRKNRLEFAKRRLEKEGLLVYSDYLSTREFFDESVNNSSNEFSRMGDFTVCRRLESKLCKKDIENLRLSGEVLITYYISRVYSMKQKDLAKAQAGEVVFIGTWAVLSSVDDQFFSDVGISRDFLIDILALSSVIKNLDPVSIFLQMQLFANRWKIFDLLDKDIIFGLSSGVAQAPTSGFASLTQYLLEIAGVAFIATMLGITENLTDLRSIKPFLSTHVIGASSNLVQYIVAIVTVFTSGDLSDFFSKVGSLVNKGKRVELLEYTEELIVLENQSDPEFGFSSHCTRVDVLFEKTLKIREVAKKLNNRFEYVAFLGLTNRIDKLKTVILSKISSKESRKEPLFFFGCSNDNSGTGKSVFPTFVANGLGRALGVHGSDANLLNYNWSTFEEFQDGFSHATRMVTIQDMWGSNPDYSKTPAMLADFILQMVSANIMPIPKAFDKGTHDTSKVLIVIANTNANQRFVEIMFNNNPENLHRRAIRYEMCWADEFLIDGRLDFNKHVGKLTPEYLGKHCKIKLWSVKKDGKEKPIFFGPVTEFSDFVYKEVTERLTGTYAKVGKELGSFLNYKNNPSANPFDSVTILPQVTNPFSDQSVPVAQSFIVSTVSSVILKNILRFIYVEILWYFIATLFSMTLLFLNITLGTFSTYMFGMWYISVSFIVHFPLIFALGVRRWFMYLFEIQLWITISTYFVTIFSYGFGHGLANQLAANDHELEMRRRNRRLRDEVPETDYDSDYDLPLAQSGQQSEVPSPVYLFYVWLITMLVIFVPQVLVLLIIILIWILSLYICVPFRTFCVFYFPDFTKAVVMSTVATVVTKNYDTASVVIKSRITNSIEKFLLKLKNSYTRLLKVIKSKTFIALVSTTLVLGSLFAFEKKKRSLDDIASAQAFTMPTSVDEKIKSEVPHVVKEYLGELIKVADMHPSQGVIRQVLPSGGGMNYTIINFMRQQYVINSPIEIDGVPVPESGTGGCYGFRTDGMLSTVSHIFPPSFTTMKVSIMDPFNPTLRGGFSGKFSDVKMIRSADFLLLPSLFPSGKKSVTRALCVENIPKVGAKVVLVGLNPDLDLYGFVVEISHISYIGPYGTEKVHGCRVQWDDGKSTINGDCGRVLFEIAGPQYIYVGRLVAGTSRDSIVAFSPNNNLKKTVSDSSTVDIAQGGVSMWNYDSILCREGPPVEYTLEGPTNGIFAYEEIRKKIPGVLIGKVPNSSAPHGNSFIPSPFGAIGKEKLKNICNKEYRLSMMKNELRYDTEMCINRIVSPFEVSASNEVMKCFFNISDLKEAIDGMSSFLDTYVKPCKPLNVNDCLMAFGPYSPVNPSTAATESVPGKKGNFMSEYQRFDNGDPLRFLNKEMLVAVEETMLRFALGHIFPGLTKSNLKDELLSKEKVESARTRIFEAQAFRYYVVNRAIGGNPKVAMSEAMRLLGSCVGINASSPEWNDVYSKVELVGEGEVALELDYNFFDKLMQFYLHVLLSEIRARFYIKCLNLHTRSLDWDVFVRSMLWNNLIVCRMIDGMIVLCYPGNASGQFDTVDVNDGINILNWFLVYRKKFPNATFKDFVRSFCSTLNVYGDDVALKLSSSLAPIFTVDFIISAMKDIGQRITGGGYYKGELKKTDTITFLKRGFYLPTFPDGKKRVFAPLAMSSIFKSLLVYKPSGNADLDDNRHFSVLKQAWEEAFLHPPSDRDLIRSVIMECWKKLPSKFSTFTMVSDNELLARWDSGNFKVWEINKLM